jgi:hypothetical protein
VGTCLWQTAGSAGASPPALGMLPGMHIAYGGVAAVEGRGCSYMNKSSAVCRKCGSPRSPVQTRPETRPVAARVPGSSDQGAASPPMPQDGDIAAGDPGRPTALDRKKMRDDEQERRRKLYS